MGVGVPVHVLVWGADGDGREDKEKEAEIHRLIHGKDRMLSVVELLACKWQQDK